MCHMELQTATRCAKITSAYDDTLWFVSETKCASNVCA
jgi:hypothetical protein